jgi:hypothetical protein
MELQPASGRACAHAALQPIHAPRFGSTAPGSAAEQSPDIRLGFLCRNRSCTVSIGSELGLWSRYCGLVLWRFGSPNQSRRVTTSPCKRREKEIVQFVSPSTKVAFHSMGSSGQCCSRSTSPSAFNRPSKLVAVQRFAIPSIGATSASRQSLVPAKTLEPSLKEMARLPFIQACPLPKTRAPNSCCFTGTLVSLGRSSSHCSSHFSHRFCLLPRLRCFGA